MGNPEGSDNCCRSKVMVRCCGDEKWQHLQNSNSNFGNFPRCGALQDVFYGKLVNVCCVVLLCFLVCNKRRYQSSLVLLLLRAYNGVNILMILAASVLTCQDGWCQL